MIDHGWKDQGALRLRLAGLKLPHARCLTPQELPPPPSPTCSELELKKSGVQGRVIYDEDFKYPGKEDINGLIVGA